MSKIEWTDRTWNPVTGCNKVSQGCKNCYAEVMHRRQMAMNPHKYSKPFLAGAEVHPDELDKPLHWKKPSRVFVNSMSDLFHEAVPFQFILNLLVVTEKCPQHTFQILTKRIERVLEFVKWRHEVSSDWVFPSNVWIGVSCEDQAAADERIPVLLQVPAIVRFLSCEPLLGPIDLLRSIRIRLSGDAELKRKAMQCRLTVIKGNSGEYLGVDWVIAGGESGHGARPLNPDWVRSLREECRQMRVPFFFKQWGEWVPDQHVSYNGPFSIRSRKHYLVDRLGNSWPYGNDVFALRKKDHRYTEAENEKASACPLTKDDDAWWMANVGKHHSGNVLDGKQHLEFPA